MSERIEKAAEYHRQGFNCAQAVVCAYCDLVDLDFRTAFKISEGLGFGMGKLGQTCGAVSGMFLLASMKNSDGNVDAPATKRATYALVNELGQAFKEKNTALTWSSSRATKSSSRLSAVMPRSEMLSESFHAKQKTTLALSVSRASVKPQ